jgi:type I restriction enzyme M protein
MIVKSLTLYIKKYIRNFIVNKQIWSLLDSFRGALDTHDYIVQLAACFIWLKQTETQVIDEQDRFDASIDATSIHSLPIKLDHAVGIVTIFFPKRRDKLSGEQIFHLMRALQDLLKAKVVTFSDLSKILKQMSADFGKAGYFPYVPEELVTLGNDLLGAKTDSVYCPFNTGYYFANGLPKASIKVGETKSNADNYLAEIDNFLLDSDFHIVQNDPISMPYYMGDGGLKQFQSAISLPPLNQKYPKQQVHDTWGRFPESSLTGDVYHLRHMLAQATDWVVCFVSNNFLFRSAAGEKQFKQDVLNQGMLKAVISLPAGLLSNTTIPVSIVVLDKSNSTKTINFIDASTEGFIEKSTRIRNRLVNVNQIIDAFNAETDSEISKQCSIEDIVANEYNLSPSRYVLSEQEQNLTNFLASHKTAKLEALVDIIRPQAVKHEDNADTAFTEYNLSSLNSIGEVVGEGKTIQVGMNNHSRVNKQVLHPNDVLVVCKGAVGKVGMATNDIAENAIASQAFSILRIKPHIASITSEVLYQYLTSEYGQLQLSSLATGTSAMMLSSKDLAAMPIPLFSAEKLSQIKEVRQQIIDTNQQIQSLKNNIKVLNNSWL